MEEKKSQNDQFILDGITVVSPMYGDRKITNRMVESVLRQDLGKDNPLHIELILVDDYIEERGENGESPYDRYVSEEYKEYMEYDSEHIEIKLIKNEEHNYQGEGREIGFLAGKYDWFILLDCDDMLAPNCCDRYRHAIESYYNAVDQNGERVNKMDLACVHGLLYSFGEHGYEHIIYGDNIWVQGRCYNRQFIIENDIHFPTGTNSRQGEDYPFIRKFDYVLRHANSEVIPTMKDWNNIKIPYGEGKDCQCTAYWFPNYESLSRKDPHYGQHLAGWTMASSNSIFDFYQDFNKKHSIEDHEDEVMKHELLNMTIYSYYNFLDFLREVAATDYDPKEEDWIALRDNVKLLRTRLKTMFWDEIVDSDVYKMLNQVICYSDIRFAESWLGTFFEYMNRGFFVKINKNRRDVLDLTYKEMREYCKKLQFDGAGHEINSPQVRAWVKRHPNG